MIKGEFIVHYGDMFRENGKCVLLVRNGDKEINVGDWYGGCRIIEIETYGLKVGCLPPGMTAKVTLEGSPSFLVEETPPELVEFIFGWSNHATRG